MVILRAVCKLLSPLIRRFATDGKAMSSTLESYVNHTVSVITADGRQIVIDDLVNLYRDFAKLPIPVSAQLLSTDNERQKSLQIVRRVRDLDRMEITKFAINYSIKVTKDGKQVKHISAVGQQTDVTNDLANSSVTKESLYLAFIRKGAKDVESGKFKQWLEIWDKTTKIKSLDIDSVEEHSSVLMDPLFGNFLLSPNGKQLLYVAEYKPPKASNYYKKQPKKLENTETETRGQEYVYRDDWGESFNGLVHSVIAILDIENDFKIRTIEMNGYSLGQPIWLTDNQIAFVGWNERPRRLGLIYCPIRSSSVFICDLKAEDTQPIRISGDGNTSVRDPRLSPDGKTIVFLENDSGGPHVRARRLLRYDLESKSGKVVFDCNGVRELIPNGNGYKYGKVCTLYVDGLTENCFTSDGKHVIIACNTELQSILCSLDLNSGQLKPIPFPTESAQLLDFKDDLLVAVGSSTTYLPNVFVGKLSDISETIDWLEIKHNSNDCLKDITSEKFWFPSEDPKKLLTSLLISPKSVESKPAPTVVIPHGGPHGNFIDAYWLYPVLLAKLGLKTLLVNYRGSTGVDEEYNHCLPGNVGSMDVKDCVDCVKHMTDRNLSDSSKLVMLSGSHGGFLITHMSGQYSDMEWKACIARNPVVDISSKFDGTDIPDWGVVETFGPNKSYDFEKPLTPDSLKVMFEKSPVNWIHNVKVPTLVMLGKADRRVPYTQGLKYYRYLKARGVETSCHIYDDKHDLQKIEVDSDAFVNIALWILSHLK